MRPLAIVTGVLGAPSETFIRRHIHDLSPGKTVTIAARRLPERERAWAVLGPALVFEELSGSQTCSTQRAMNWVADFLIHHDIGVVLGEYLDWSYPFFRVCQQLGVEFFVHGHGRDMSTVLTRPEWHDRMLHYNAAAGIIVVHEQGRQDLVRLGVSPAKVHVIPCGVTVGACPFPKSASATIRCVSVGRLVRKKGIFYTLRAFAIATASAPTITLDVIGDGPLMNAAVEYARELGLGTRVTFHGTQDHRTVLQYLNGADVFLQHSLISPEDGDCEGLPVAILEAMAAGVPVLSTYHAGIPDAINDGVHGFLVTPGDALSMADRLIRLAHNVELRHRMGHCGWQRATETFSWGAERRALRSLLHLDEPTLGQEIGKE